MTVSMLRGRSGYQAKEIDRLTRHLSARSQPDVLVLSNSLLVGLARPLQDALKVPVVCTIQGECHFIEAMGEPWASQAWELLSDGLRGCAGRIAVSDFVATRVSDRTGVPLDGFEVVHNGIDLQGYQPTHDPTEPFVLGFLARMYGKKGLAQLAEIFTAIREQRDDIELAVAGTLNEGDERDVESFEQTLRARGLMRHVRMAPNLSPEAKRDFLSQITVFCVPSEKDETFGLYHLEALASRVPVVAPRRGAVPEVLGRTGGALLVDDGDVQGFARAIIGLTEDPERRHQLGQEGYTGVRQHFTHQQMARRELEVLQELLRTMRQGAPPLDSGSSRAFT
jgi:glycosyltransferase involved in cell wall biosynthesis